MGDKNTSSKLVENHSSVASQQSTIIELYYGATTDGEIKNKQDCGMPISQDSIAEIRLTESIFGTLPKLTIKIYDNGEWATTFAFRAGNNIRLRITPVDGNPDMLQNPYLDCFFTLEGVNTYMNQAAGKYIYELSCIYACETFINSVCTWPETEVMAKLKGYKKTSKEVLQQLVEKAALKFNYRCPSDPTDKMLWLNKTLTYAKFAKHIIDHAWIGENDLPLMYINKNGQFVYDSLVRMCTQGISYSYMFEQNYNKLRQVNKNLTYKPYMDLLFYNLPYKAFDDGCTIQSVQYNPYNRSDIDTDKQKPQKVQDDQENSFRQYEFNGNGTRLSNISNKSNKSLHLVNKREYSGIYFKELHEYYNVAPLHHKNIRNSFFTNFCYMTLNMDDQSDVKQNDPQAKQEDKKIAKTYINLGDKVYIDASDSKYTNKILSGEYIVSGLTHIWAPNHNYTILVQGVNDGTYNEGYMSIQTDIDKMAESYSKYKKSR